MNSHISLSLLLLSLLSSPPLPTSLSHSLQDLKKYGATTVVRVCEVTYDKTPLEKDGITVVVSGLLLRHVALDRRH